MNTTSFIYDTAADQCERTFETLLQRLWRRNMISISLQAPGMFRQGVIGAMISRFDAKGWYVEEVQGGYSGTWLMFVPKEKLDQYKASLD